MGATCSEPHQHPAVPSVGVVELLEPCQARVSEAPQVSGRNHSSNRVACLTQVARTRQLVVASCERRDGPAPDWLMGLARKAAWMQVQLRRATVPAAAAWEICQLA